MLEIRGSPGAEKGFPGSADGKESAIPGEGNGNPLQYSCLENSINRGAWRGHRESDTTEQLTL